MPGESYLHKADPRVKVILSLFFIVLVLWSHTVFDFALMFLFLIFVVITSKIKIISVLKSLKFIIIIIFALATINIFIVKGTVLIEYGFLKISIEGIKLSVKMFLKLLLLIIGTSIVSFTTTTFSFSDGIEKIAKPLKKIRVPVHDIAMMVAIALRFLPVLMEETNRIIMAQKSRGANFKSGNLIQRVRDYIAIFLPLFMSVFRRADELAVAMDSRCYRGGRERTRLNPLKITGTDYKISGAMICFTVLIIILRSVF